MTEYSYHWKQERNDILTTRELLKELPDYVADFISNISTRCEASTRLAYVRDLKIFLQFLSESEFAQLPIHSITAAHLTSLNIHTMERYQEHLKLYMANGCIEKNENIGIARKLSTLRSFFKYCVKAGILQSNPAELLDMPKKARKEILYLEPDEIVKLLDGIEHFEERCSPHQLMYYNRTRYRDLALITLFLGTGIRISECVGLDLADVHIVEQTIHVTRKGNKEQTLYFGQEVRQALTDYLQKERSLDDTLGTAFFLSMRKTRLSVDAAENIVEKYASIFIPDKHITPHKLRSTFGTALYQETGDISLVAEVLGHSSVDTTRKHYAEVGHRTRIAATAITLRETEQT